MNPSTPDVRNSDVNEAINQALCACNGPGCPDCNYEVASPESSTAQTGTTGMAAKASVDVPEKIEVYPQDATEKGFPESSEAQVVTLQSRGSLISGVVTGAENETKAKLSTEGEPQTLASGIVMVETREAHNLEVAGSNPVPATNSETQDTQRCQSNALSPIRPSLRSEQELPQDIAGIAGDGNRVGSGRTAPMRLEIGQTRACLGASVEAGSISIESLADFNDEGETAWNAIRRAEVARKMNRIAAGGYNSVDKLIGKVEELAEVGQ